MLCYARSLQSCLSLCIPGDYSPPCPCPWDSPGENIGVGCHALVQHFICSIDLRFTFNILQSLDKIHIEGQSNYNNIYSTAPRFILVGLYDIRNYNCKYIYIERQNWKFWRWHDTSNFMRTEKNLETCRHCVSLKLLSLKKKRIRHK